MQIVPCLATCVDQDDHILSWDPLRDIEVGCAPIFERGQPGFNGEFEDELAGDAFDVEASTIAGSFASLRRWP